jgi:hypothetical protein
MAIITVNLRIAGLYFWSAVKVDNTKTLSVKDVIDAYIATNPANPDGTLPVNGLSYEAVAKNGDCKNLSVLSFTHHYDGKFNENGLQDRCGRTIGGKIRPAGLYRLQEIALDPLVVAWQYYVIDGVTNKNKSKTSPIPPPPPRKKGFTEFNLPLHIDPANPDPRQGIADGDTIIWRMVAIVRRPNVFLSPTACEGAYTLSE